MATAVPTKRGTYLPNCTTYGGESSVSYRGGPGLIPGQSVWVSCGQSNSGIIFYPGTCVFHCHCQYPIAAYPLFYSSVTDALRVSVSERLLSLLWHRWQQQSAYVRLHGNHKSHTISYRSNDLSEPCLLCVAIYS
jgi:hypothetical protein